jgi:4-hydroxybenzoate polyprenyltransferase
MQILPAGRAVPYKSDMLLCRLLELIRFSHTVFALPFAFIAAMLAWQDEPFRVLDLVGIVLCMVFARSAAMAFNRLADQDIDAKNPRTAGRHLPAGLLSRGTVMAFLAACSLGFFGSTLLFALREPRNPWPAYLSVPVFAFILGYSRAKRFTSLAHFWLGAALMLAPVAAWIAIRGPVALEAPLILGAAVLFWVAGFDVLYACQDAAFDRAEGLHSIPVKLGVRGSLRLAAACHAVMFALLVLLGFAAEHLGSIYFAGLSLIGVLLIYEHLIVSPDDLSRVNRAFFQVNGVISIGLFLLVCVQIAVKTG